MAACMLAWTQPQQHEVICQPGAQLMSVLLTVLCACRRCPLGNCHLYACPPTTECTRMMSCSFNHVCP